MANAQEQYIYIKCQFSREGKVGITQKVVVYIVNMVAGIAFTMHKYDLHIGVVDQYPQHFAAGVTSATNNACFNPPAP